MEFQLGLFDTIVTMEAVAGGTLALAFTEFLDELQAAMVMMLMLFGWLALVMAGGVAGRDRGGDRTDVV